MSSENCFYSNDIIRLTYKTQLLSHCSKFFVIIKLFVLLRQLCIPLCTQNSIYFHILNLNKASLTSSALLLTSVGIWSFLQIFNCSLAFFMSFSTRCQSTLMYPVWFASYNFNSDKKKWETWSLIFPFVKINHEIGNQHPSFYFWRHLLFEFFDDLQAKCSYYIQGFMLCNGNKQLSSIAGNLNVYAELFFTNF